MPRVRFKGQVVQSRIRANSRLKFNLLGPVSWCISARLFISKLERRNLALIQSIFLKKHFQIYIQAC
jgi:hypothetical protein